MEDRTHERFKRAARRERDNLIKNALRKTGRKPPKSQRRLKINAEYAGEEYWEDRKTG